MIFVDTGAWFALFVRDDPSHAQMAAFVTGTAEALVTTDYVVDETLTLCKVRRGAGLAVEVGRALFKGDLARVDYCTRGDISRAWELFEKYRDKGWSFTDCASFAFMKRVRPSRALATDRHFDQFPGLGRVSVA